MEKKTDKRRNRYKVECIECGKKFDMDYKKKHEELCHNRNTIRVKCVGSPANPFEAAAVKKRRKDDILQIPSPLNDVNDGISSQSGIVNIENTLPEAEANHPEKIMTEKQQENAASNVIINLDVDMAMDHKIDNIPDKTINQMETKTDTHITDWTTAIGKFKVLLSYYDNCSEIFSRCKNAELIHPDLILTEISEITEIIQTQCKSVLESCESAQVIRSKMSGNVDGDVVVRKMVEHDPGVRTKIQTDAERDYLMNIGPHQPNLSIFPVNTSIPLNKQNRFSPSWYKQYPHLEYSITKDAAYCFTCFLFPEGPSRENSEPMWKEIGVRQWHKMKSVGKEKLGKLSQHFSSKTHKAALADFCQYSQKDKHIDVQLDKSKRMCMIQEKHDMEFNSKILNILFDVAKTLGRQGMSFRGSSSDEDGNFRQIVYLISRHSLIMKKWLDDRRMRPYHVTYLSADSQNEFIDLLAKEVKKVVVNKVNDCSFFSVMADTTPDASHQDQMSICVRFVEEGTPKEHLLEVVKVEEKTGDALSKKIIESLVRNQLKIENLAFQSYDFASSMSGQFNGVQQKLTTIIGREIVYIPCQAHRMNTFIEHSCNTSPIISSFFDILQGIYVFFMGSTKKYAKLSSKITETENFLGLKNLSKTRWTARAESIKAVNTSLEVIIELLEEISISSDFDTNTKTKANSLKKNILTFDFIFSLMFMKNLLYKSKIVTEMLEKETSNLLDALMFLESTMKSYEEIRKDVNSVNGLVHASATFCEKLGIDVEREFALHHRRRKKPARFDSANKTEAELTLQAFYRKECNMVLDELINLMNTNLKECIKKVSPLFQSLRPPLKRSNFTLSTVHEMLKFYPDKNNIPEANSLQCELEVFSDFCTQSLKMSEVMEKSDQMKAQLKLSNSLCQLVFTAPVSVASNERSFSVLKRVKNYLRSKMNEDRLDSLILLSIEKEILDKLCLNSIVCNWGLLRKRRVKVN